jgi:hypothetical protein
LVDKTILVIIFIIVYQAASYHPFLKKPSYYLRIPQPDQWIPQSFEDWYDYFCLSCR